VTHYHNGYVFERKVAADLTGDGYYCVQARGSHGVADVVALKAGQVLLVQCKTNGDLPPGEWNALFEHAASAGAVPLLAWRPDRGVIQYLRLTGTRTARMARAARPCQLWRADEILSTEDVDVGWVEFDHG
jgi:Holliday junction resolvase